MNWLSRASFRPWMINLYESSVIAGQCFVSSTQCFFKTLAKSVDAGFELST